MPGRHLNNNEKSLLDGWKEPSADFSVALLKAIAIEGSPALRGIQKIYVPFNYPITAICGRNSVGKSTILALAAFSAKRPSDWQASTLPTLPMRKRTVRMNYHWNDFFFRHYGDPAPTGLTVKFTYRLSGDDIEIARRRTPTNRWQTLPILWQSRRHTFPTRAIEFVSLSRILPANELRDVRRAFGSPHQETTQELKERIRAGISRILGNKYESVKMHETKKSKLMRCRVQTDYSGFDMGAGENAAIAILSALERLPSGGLLLVEEIEHGFHPEAQCHLIDILTETIRRKQQQIILTTHSEHIIDHLPREARILINKENDSHRVISQPTTRLAISIMKGVAQPEVKIYVEDTFSADLVTYCLPADIRSRILAVPVGDKAKVAGQLGAHIRGNSLERAGCVFDGDCDLGEIKRWMRSEELTDVENKYVLLPGGEPPELWVVKELWQKPYLDRFCQLLAFHEKEQEVIQILKDITNSQNHHAIPYAFAKRFGMNQVTVATTMLLALAPTHPSLENIRRFISGLLP